jgi:glycosyltransferase involved in cell wall biosynthesis
LKLLYVYPQHHTVSFTLIARKHVEYMRRLELAEIQELDELSLPSFTPHVKYNAILHPWMYIYHRLLQTKLNTLNETLRDRLPMYLKWWRSNYNQLVAIDVCDSDRMSDYAVELLNQADKVIVPSSYCVQVYRSSGVRAPAYRVPHGVDPEWYTTPNLWDGAPARSLNPALLEVYLYKVKRNRKLLLFWLWHSSTRKGWPEVREVYSRLVRERKDVVLLLKTTYPNMPEFQEVMHLGAVQVYGWLSEYEKMALYDLADVTLVFSRGGGFEVNALESLARGVPVVTSNVGSWTDYVPPYLQVRVGGRVRVFEDNAVHVGYGYKVDVESAVDRIHDILENYDEYRGRVEEWRHKVLVKEYRWDRVALMLADVARLKPQATTG